MTATTGIWNREAAGNSSPSVTAMDGAANNSGNSSTSDPATISSNDFLTLLVTEMQNQDPTATTDPNEYINQLVNVNSLQQLISINQTLSTALGGTSGSASPGTGASSNATGTAASTERTNNSSSSSHAAAAENVAPAHVAASNPALYGAHSLHVPGNLGIPATNASAQRVAESLGGV